MFSESRQLHKCTLWAECRLLWVLKK